MPYDDDTARGHSVRHIEIPERPVTPVQIDDDVVQAIRALSAQYPNLGYPAVLSEVRGTYPDVTVDEVRTVMAER